MSPADIVNALLGLLGLIFLLLTWYLGERQPERMVRYTHGCRQVRLPPGGLVRAPDRNDGVPGELEEAVSQAVLEVSLLNAGRESVEDVRIVATVHGARVEVQPRQELPPVRLVATETLADGATMCSLVLDRLNVESVVQFDVVCVNGDCEYRVMVETSNAKVRYVPPAKFFRDRNSRWALTKILGESVPAVPPRAG